MFITSIRIAREGYFSGYTAPDSSKPFTATIEVHGRRGKVELMLSPELSARVVSIIADEVAAAGRETAEAMTADCLTVAAIAGPGQ